MHKLIINTTNKLIKTGLLSKVLETEAITGVDLVANTITVGADLSGFLEAGRVVRITGSTGNNGKYTMRSVEVSGSDTIITMVQQLPDATVDGDVSYFDAIDTANKTIILDEASGDVSAEFTAGLPIGLIGSAVAGNAYTVASSSYDGTRTSVVVNEDISSPEAAQYEQGSELSWTAAGGANDVLFMNQPSANGGNLEFGAWNVTVREGSLPHHQNAQYIVFSKGNFEFSALPTDIVLDGTAQTGDASTVAAAIETVLNP